MRHIVEQVGKKNLFQLGIRSGTREEMEYASKMTNLYLDQLVSALSEVKVKVGQRPVYLTVDIDVVDPAYAPGTGTPEPGGFTSRDLLQTLH
jgi:agmatinase